MTYRIGAPSPTSSAWHTVRKDHGMIDQPCYYRARGRALSTSSETNSHCVPPPAECRALRPARGADVASAHGRKWHRPTVRRCRSDRVRNLGGTADPVGVADHTTKTRF